MQNRAVYPLVILSLLIVLVSCDPYQKIVKSTDTELKYAKAVEYFNKKKYDRAQPLFEELIQVYKGTKDIAELYYYYAYCGYGLGEYMIAAFHFKQIAINYSSSQYAEECLYMTAYCYYRLSPEASLDQTYTLYAVDAFQLFINSYPQSSLVPKCNDLVDELWRKLEVKSFASSNLYFKIGQYQAAAVSFENFTNDYPDSEDVEEAIFLISKSYFLLAENSVESKKAERYDKAIDAYDEFLYRYPTSKWMGEAQIIYKSSKDQINKLNGTL